MTDDSWSQNWIVEWPQPITQSSLPLMCQMARRYPLDLPQIFPGTASHMCHSDYFVFSDSMLMFFFLSFLLSSTETTVHMWLHLLSDPDSGHHQDVSPAHGVLRGQSRRRGRGYSASAAKRWGFRLSYKCTKLHFSALQSGFHLAWQKIAASK